MSFWKEFARRWGILPPPMPSEPKSALFEQSRLNTQKEGAPLAYLAGSKVYVGQNIIEGPVATVRVATDEDTARTINSLNKWMNSPDTPNDAESEAALAEVSNPYAIERTSEWKAFWKEPKNAAALEAIERYEKRSNEALKRFANVVEPRTPKLTPEEIAFYSAWMEEKRNDSDYVEAIAAIENFTRNIRNLHAAAHQRGE